MKLRDSWHVNSLLPFGLLIAISSVLTQDLSEVPQVKNEKVTVCYYTSWSHYRQGLAHYQVEDIPVELCSHVIYAFAILDADSLTLTEQDTFADIQNYRRFIRLKQRNPGVKLLLGLGGWHDSRTGKYSRLVSSTALRETFIKHSLEFLQSYGFDGLDIKWEYPAYQGPASDKEGFRLWVKDLSEAFKPLDLLLTATVTGHIGIIERGYDIKAITQDLHQIHLAAYDFHGFWENRVNHHAPLYPVSGNRPEFSVDFAVRHWLSRGTPASKLVLGVPFYGRSWTLAGIDAATGALASDKGRPGPLLKVPGTSAYYELCLAYSRYNWPKITNDEGTFLTLHDQWISYDDVESIKRKAEYVVQTGLKGIMVWDVSMDDFRNLCGNGVNPLLSAIYNTLNKGKKGLENTQAILDIESVTETITEITLNPNVDRSTTTKNILVTTSSEGTQLVTEKLSSLTTASSLVTQTVSSNIERNKVNLIPTITIEPPKRLTPIFLPASYNSNSDLFQQNGYLPTNLNTGSKPVEHLVTSMTSSPIPGHFHFIGNSQLNHNFLQTNFNQPGTTVSEKNSTYHLSHIPNLQPSIQESQSSSQGFQSTSLKTFTATLIERPVKITNKPTQSFRPSESNPASQQFSSTLPLRPTHSVRPFGITNTAVNNPASLPFRHMQSFRPAQFFRPTQSFRPFGITKTAVNNPGLQPIGSPLPFRRTQTARPFVITNTDVNNPALQPVGSPFPFRPTPSSSKNPAITMQIFSSTLPVRPTQSVRPTGITKIASKNLILTSPTLPFNNIPLYPIHDVTTTVTLSLNEVPLRITRTPAGLTRPHRITRSSFPLLTTTKTIQNESFRITETTTPPRITRTSFPLLTTAKTKQVITEPFRITETTTPPRITRTSFHLLTTAKTKQVITEPFRITETTLPHSITRTSFHSLTTTTTKPVINELLQITETRTHFIQDTRTIIDSVAVSSPAKVISSPKNYTNTISEFTAISPFQKLKPTKTIQTQLTSVRPPATSTMKVNFTLCKTIGYAPDLSSCSHFYRCDNSRAFHFRCPEKLHWRQDLLTCDWAHKKICKSFRSVSSSNEEDSYRQKDQLETIIDEATGAVGYFSQYI